MGIKFLCPNGHKLHVKAFLGGKRAICPKCGARVVVPSESESDIGSALHRSSDQSAESSAPASSSDDTFEATTVSATSGGTAVESRPSTPAQAADPFDEAPGAIWYVRPASGGQFGPASAEIMRAWLAEGRVGANSLVWRAPWPEWRSAASLFVGFGLPADAPGNGTATPTTTLPVGYAVTTTGPAPSEAAPPPPPSMTPLVEAARKRRKRNDVTLVASGLLAVASIVLVIVLVLVWRAQTRENAAETEQPGPASEASTL